MKIKQRPQRATGFTLIEIMVVVVILGILAAMVAPKILSRPDQAKVTVARSDIETISQALELFRLDNGFYPTMDQGLEALIKKPTAEPEPRNWNPEGYLKKAPLDPWGASLRLYSAWQSWEVRPLFFGCRWP